MFTTVFLEEFAALRILAAHREKDSAAFCERLIRFIQEEVTEKNINAYLPNANVVVFSSILLMVSQSAFGESERVYIENVINALLAKKPIVDKNTLYWIMSSPILLDVFLKKVDPLKKQELLATVITRDNARRLFFQNPDTIRVLINHGLSTGEFISSFKNFDFGSDKAWMSRLSKDFPTPTDADSKEYKEFYDSELVKVRREIIRRIRLALVFPSGEKLSTLGDISFERDGASYPIILSYFQESFQHYASTGQATENKALKEYFKELSERTEIIKEASELLLGHQKAGNRIIPVRTQRGPGDSHAEGLFVFDDLLMKINRGARSNTQESGITIFKKSPETAAALLEAYLSMVSMDDQQVDRWVLGDEFDEDIADKVMPNPLTVLRMKDQKVGNCTWATSKAFVQAVYFAVIRKHLLQKSKDPAADENVINKQASLIAKSMYKDFARTHRAQEIKKYFDAHVEDSFKLADQEILIKMIKHAFGIKGELLENIKRNQALRKLMGEKKRLFLVFAVKNDDLDLIRFVLGCSQNPLDEEAINGILSTAIETNASKTIANFKMLFGALKNTSQLNFSIWHLGMKEIDSNKVIALIKNYSPVPYEAIAKALKVKIPIVARLSDNEQKARLGYIQTIQRFCADQLIEESRSEASIILAKKIDPEKALAEVAALRDKQRILKELIVGLPDTEQRTFEANLEGIVSKATVVQYDATRKQPPVVASTTEAAGTLAPEGTSKDPQNTHRDISD